MTSSCFPCFPAFSLLPFTPSDPHEAFITVLQQVPEVARYFTSRLTRLGRNKFFLRPNTCGVICFKAPACQHHVLHANVPAVYISVLHRRLQLCIYAADMPAYFIVLSVSQQFDACAAIMSRRITKMSFTSKYQCKQIVSANSSWNSSSLMFWMITGVPFATG